MRIDIIFFSKKRNYLVFYIFQLFLGFNCNAQSYSQMIKQANSLYQKGEYGESLHAFEKAFSINIGSAADLYNAACSASLLKNSDKAFLYLAKAIDAGWEDSEYLKNDSDFNNIRNDRRWAEYLEKLEGRLLEIKKTYNLALRNELLSIYEDDQSGRLLLDKYIRTDPNNKAAIDSIWKQIDKSDSINVQRASSILNTYGWVGPDKVGSKASMTLFLVLQHSELKVQKKYFPLLKKAVDEGNAKPEWLALMEDRIAILDHEQQTYGTQLFFYPKENQYIVLPLKDPDNVDIRRKKVGLGSMAEYLIRWNTIWDVTKYKEQLPEIEKWAKELY
jgi:tetratricopeptide (TPR) repeat protein